MHQLLLTGIDLTFQQRYASADSVFRLLATLYPDHPVGVLYQAGLRETLAMDYEMDLEKNGFDSLMAIAIKKSDALLEEDRTSIWNRFFRGTALGYESYASAYRGEWFGAVQKAMASANEFRKCIEQDSSFIEACAGVGTYLYWKSRKTEFLNWLPFIKDERQEGLRLLKVSAERATLNRYTAVNSLISIYLDAENYPASEEYARVGLERYPSNRSFLWGLATSLDRGNKKSEAIQAYELLLRAIREDTRENHYNEIVCRLNLVKLKLATGDTVQVAAHLGSILVLEDSLFPEHLKDRAGQKFKEARNIRRQFSRASRRE